MAHAVEVRPLNMTAGPKRLGPVVPRAANSRSTVYAFNGSAAADPFVSRGLMLVHVASNDEPVLEPDARAVLFMGGDFASADENRLLSKWAARTVRHALDRGAACLVVVQPGQDGRARELLQGADRDGRVRIAQSVDAAAQLALLHEPGAYPGAVPAIVPAGACTEEAELLLKRAFHQFERVELETLPGGRSGAHVWRADCQSADRDLSSPFVVKFGPRARIGEELNTYRDAVADRIPFRGCAPICVERSVEGSAGQVLVSRFVEDAVRLDTLLVEGRAPLAEHLVTGIYDGPLHRWRRNTTRADLRLFHELCNAHVRSKPEKLQDVWQRQGGAKARLPSPRTVFKQLSAITLAGVPVCQAHDDLNLRNIFVAQPGSDVILIDFTRSKRRPLSRDIARLDVALGFDTDLQDASPLEADLLLEFYAADHFRVSLLHPSHCPRGKARLDLIQALRRRMVLEARREGYDPPVEYSVALASELLYHARGMSKSAEIAYRCACRIAADLTRIVAS